MSTLSNTPLINYSFLSSLKSNMSNLINNNSEVYSKPAAGTPNRTNIQNLNVYYIAGHSTLQNANNANMKIMQIAVYQHLI